jgi:phosphoribosylanthranilate isomerase
MMMTRIKFCGLTRREDVIMAADVGAGAVGLQFWKQSPRAVSPEEARALVRVMPPFLAMIGVFVDQPVDEIREIVRFVGLTAVQLHGRETPADAAALDGHAGHVIKAIGDPDLDLMTQAAVWPEPRVLLVDAIDPTLRGGTGRRADWNGAATLARARRVILAGGLRPDNVGEAVRQVRPYAVDVASGVEVRPGIKDHARMRAFAEAVRAVDLVSAGAVQAEAGQVGAEQAGAGHAAAGQAGTSS